MCPVQPSTVEEPEPPLPPSRSHTLMSPRSLPYADAGAEAVWSLGTTFPGETAELYKQLHDALGSARAKKGLPTLS